MLHDNKQRNNSITKRKKQRDATTFPDIPYSEMTTEERRIYRQAKRAERLALNREATIFDRTSRRNGGGLPKRSSSDTQGESNKRNKKMSKHPAKWYANNGVMINKIKVLGGMFYAGHDMSGMVEPNIYEPSLVSPVYGIAKNTEGVKETTQYLTYEYLDPTQRRAYLEFLASNRKQVDDIGYVFLYVYGLERRLLIDAKKPDVVSPEEHSKIVKEVARLLRCFGKQSKSLAKYLRLLLLYDGKIFEIYNEKQIRQLFEVRSDYEGWTDNSNALIYLTIARYLENGIQINLDQVFECARQRLIRTRLNSLTNVSRDDLYEEPVVALAKDRIKHAGLNMRVSIDKPTNIHIESRPMYYPSSVSLRRRSFPVDTSVCLDIENVGIDFKAVADIILASYYDYRRAREVLQTSSLRGLDEIPLDALRACLPAFLLEEMARLIGGRERLADIQIADLVDPIKRGIGYTLKTSQSGLLNQSAVDVVSTLYSSIGWQCCSQTTVDDPMTNAWRFRTDGRNVLFKRGYMRSRGSGKQILAPVFGNDRGDPLLNIPESWGESIALAYIYAWFLQQLGSDATNEDLLKITPASYPPFTRRNKQAQTIVFFGILHATYYADLSNHGLKLACQRAHISKVQSEIFSLCMNKYGYQLPTHAFDAIKKIYDKYPNADANNILYDYHAGDYRISYDVDNEVEFVIDDSKIRKIIAETSDVHRILERAFIEEEDEDDADISTNVGGSNASDSGGIDLTSHHGREFTADGGRGSSEHVETSPLVSDDRDVSSSSAPNNISVSTASDDITTAWNIICETFGDNDEIGFNVLCDALTGAKLAETVGDVIALINSVNELIGNGDEIVEVDGRDVYLNEE